MDKKVVDKLLNNMYEDFMTEKIAPWWSSSANPEELSLTIKGMLMMYVPAIIGIAQLYNYTLDKNVLINLIGLISFAIAGLMVVGGLLRKIYYRWFNK